jgi:ABC-type siderophore export system fused ATPase/permease subunit
MVALFMHSPERDTLQCPIPPPSLPRTWATSTRFAAPSAKRIHQEIVDLEGVDLAAPHGELFGLLGPNGAGKTTLIMILTTLLLPPSGSARVQGLDVAAAPQEIRQRISMVSGGETSGLRLLLSGQGHGRLGGHLRLDHPLDPGPGRHAPVDV